MYLESPTRADGSFEKIVETHHAEIYQYLRHVVSYTATDRLVQETFVHAFRTHRSLPADANTRAWLFAIATRVCRRHFRSKRRSPAASIGSEVHRPAARGPLEMSIRRLPVPQRLALTMRRLHGLDYGAIAASLDCTPATARAHVLQAVRRIRRQHGELARPQAETSLSEKPGAATGWIRP